ncbi:hypothetical protein niasHS_008989 [Heterodera schachtii]|uniref:Uncharacterized protein n=1 Tax=Heterodera schachtii TaxID=97005 RepID=A0ABD2J3C3_HETSC
MPFLYIFLLFNVVCADFGNEGLSQVDGWRGAMGSSRPFGILNARNERRKNEMDKNESESCSAAAPFFQIFKISTKFLPLLLFRRWPGVLLFVALSQFMDSSLAIKPHLGKKNCSNKTEQTTTPTTTTVPTTTVPTTTTTARPQPQNDVQRPSSSSNVDLFKSFWNFLNTIWLFPVTIFAFVLLLSGDGDIRRRLFNSGVPTLPELQPAVVKQPIAELPAIVEPAVLVPDLGDPIQPDGLLVLDEVDQPDDGPVADAPDQPLPPQLRNLPENSPADLSHYVVAFGHQFNGNIV